ncbi:MAG: S8 family serine peptidase [Elusimicrobiota bacterium]
MRRYCAVILSASLILAAPGPGSWASAAQVVIPKTGAAPVVSGGVAVPVGAQFASGMQAGFSAAPALSLGVLPGMDRTPSQGAVFQLPVSLTLPVSPALRRSHQGLSGVTGVPGVMPVQPGTHMGDAQKTGRLRQASPYAAQPSRGAFKNTLLQSLRLPSRLKDSSQMSGEELSRTAEHDFRLHAGAGAGGGSGAVSATPYKGSAVFAAPSGAGHTAVPGEASGIRQGWQALAKLFARSGPAGLPSGVLKLHTPDGPVKSMNIRSVAGRAPGSAGGSAVLKNSAVAEKNTVSDVSAEAIVPGGKAAPAMSGSSGVKPAAAIEKSFSVENGSESGAPVREYRSAYFPLTVAMVSAAVLGLALGLPALLQTIAPALLPSAALQSLSASAGVEFFGAALRAAVDVIAATTALSAAYALWEAFTFALGVAVRKPVSDQEFWSFIRQELKGWDLHPSVRESLLGTGPGRGMLKPYRPPGRFGGLAYGFTAGGAIYLRPEMIRTPWLFRWVLKHELVHLNRHFSRGPPERLTGLHRISRFFVSELGARFGEWRSIRKLRSLRIPVLHRVLSAARLSLKRSKPYDMLIVHPGHHESRNSKTYAELSGGLANVVELYTKDQSDKAALQIKNDAFAPDVEAGIQRLSSGDRTPDGKRVRDYLQREENDSRFRLIVYPQSFGALPAAASNDGRKLRRALQRLDRVYMLSRQMPLLQRIETVPTRRIGQIERLINSLGIAWKPGMSPEHLEQLINEMYYRASRDVMSDDAFVQTLESVYDALHHRGSLLLPFAPGEPGLDMVERVMRYWRAEDGGRFNVMRVDLPEGGHVLVARKSEPRVDLWLRPAADKAIKKSVTNVNTARNQTPSPEDILREAGFNDADLERFKNADMEVRHVFGADVGDNRIYVNVRRSHAQLLKQYAVEAGIQFQSSERFALHLVESGPLQKADKVWKLGFTGAGGRIYDIDTGLDTSHPDFADRHMESVDFVDEGPEDWIGHGTHKAGISYANGTIYRGMAPGAEGRMGKVFAQNGMGASDGEIMAAAVDAMQWGADVISLSLGSPGAVESPLAEFFSRLTKQKNAKGEYPIVTGSAGNSGPFNSTKSQPSVGENVASITAAAKSLDDGVPEISFYSSVGPAYDRRYGRLRYRRPLGLTALGGDVTTPPGVKDVYADGIESVKSKDMPAGPSDAADGRHTRMSGTSMSNPMIAGIALLVKQAVQSVVKSGTEAYDFFTAELPFAVNMILMRSAEDMRVPIFFQEGGFVDAQAAVQLAVRSFGGELIGGMRRAVRAVRSLGRSTNKVSEAAANSDARSWDWIVRAKAVWELEDRPFAAGERARQRAIKNLQAKAVAAPGGNIDGPEESPQADMVSKRKLGDAGNRAMQKDFDAVRSDVVPALIEALQDKVWIVRMYAAFALLNLRAPEAVLPLADAALQDADGRVRQTAFLALAETSGYAADEALRQALNDGRPDVEMYAAYALARHGVMEGIARISAHARNADKKVRFTAVWLLGQLGRRAPPEVTDVLARRVIDTDERGNIRHLSVASLTEVARARPESLTNETILNLLYSSGPQNFALTRTIAKFFAVAAQSSLIRDRMAEKPLREDILRFIHKYKNAVHRPGALGEMVRLLSRILNVPLDSPTPLPNPSGEGVPGVDPNLGPVDLIVEFPEDAPAGARIQRFEDFRAYSDVSRRGEQSRQRAAQTLGELGLAPEMVGTHGADLQVAMPHSQSLWFSVPDAKVVAFASEMESRGYRVRRAAPMYRLLHETGELSGMPALREKSGLTGDGVLVAYLDEGGDTQHPALPAKRIRVKKNFTTDGRSGEVERESVSHGTHGMGIVGGESVDGSPYVGMAPGVEFAIGKVLGATGGSEATVMAGMEWAASLSADPLKDPVIINMSLGGPGAADSPISRLVNRLRLKNIGVVAAAGNSGPMEGTVSSPANAALAISVGAVDKAKHLADYSSRSEKGVRELSWVDFGGAVFFDRPNLYDIVSALNTRLQEEMADSPTGVKWKDKLLYHTMSGTSMAAPHTTGKLAVLVEGMRKAFPEGLPTGYLFYIEKLVEATAARMKDNGENEVGAGLIDEAAALAALEKALTDPAKVRSESEAMIRRAAADYGQPAAPASAGGWLAHLRSVPRAVGSVVHSFMTLFLF